MMEIERPDWRAFGRTVKQLREGRGWGRKRLARYAGVSDAWIRQLEEEPEIHRPSLDVVLRISGVFDLTAYQVMVLMGLSAGGEDCEARRLYAVLSPVDRRFLMKTARALVERNAEFSAALDVPDEDLTAEPTG